MNNPLIKYGLIMGIGLIIYTMILYGIDKNLIFALSFSFFIPIIFKIFVMIKSGLTERAMSDDGTLSFGEAVKATYVPWVIGSGIFVVFNYILFNFIDPGLIDVMKEQAIETAHTFAGIFSEKEIDDDLLREAIDQQDMQVGIGASILDFVGSLIGGILLALILSIFIKRD